ncbi:MAG TPA: RraA family protein [Acidobacteriota bacterium]|nr:RraA family protein [Acidobacteriota bacterium]
MSLRPVPVQVLETLQKYDSATISNVIELFGVRQRNVGYMNPSIHALFPDFPPIVGYASTATYRSARPLAKGDLVSNLVAQVEAMASLPTPRIVVFEDIDHPPAAATFGEVMCAIYQAFGAVGLITSGAARDLEALKSRRFATFASSVCVSHGFGRIEEVHTNVHVGGLTIRPGDLLHADCNGVVLIPLEIAEKVAVVCSDWIAAERIVLDYVDGTGVTVEGLSEKLEEMGKRISQITIAGQNKPELV